MVIFLAALQDVPRSLYEAATVDGANEGQKLLHITIPMCSPVILFNLVMAFISGFQYFTLPWLLTQGGPNRASEFISVYLYRNAFLLFNMGKASALAWLLFLVIITFTFILFKGSGRFCLLWWRRHSKRGIEIIMSVWKFISARKVTAIKSHGKEKVRTLGQSIRLILQYAVLLILSFTYILPLVWMAVSALKVDSQVYTIPPIWIPIPTHWNNFVDAWTSYNFNLYVFDTVVKYAIPATLLTVVSSSLVAYSFARLRWRSRNFLFAICLMTMMIPSQVTMVPLFITYKHLGWLNTYLPLIAPSLFGDAYFIFLLRQFFLGIPQDLSDAAKIDGCNELAILWRIVLPLSIPALAVVALFRFLWAWNDYFGPLIYLNQELQFTVALGIENLRRTMEQVGSRLMAYPYLMAVSTIVTIPVLIAFFFAQRTFIEGISMTGIKG